MLIVKININLGGCSLSPSFHVLLLSKNDGWCDIVMQQLQLLVAWYQCFHFYRLIFKGGRALGVGVDCLWWLYWQPNRFATLFYIDGMLSCTVTVSCALGVAEYFYALMTCSCRMIVKPLFPWHARCRNQYVSFVHSEPPEKKGCGSRVASKLVGGWLTKVILESYASTDPALILVTFWGLPQDWWSQELWPGSYWHAICSVYASRCCIYQVSTNVQLQNDCDIGIDCSAPSRANVLTSAP